MQESLTTIIHKEIKKLETNLEQRFNELSLQYQIEDDSWVVNVTYKFDMADNGDWDDQCTIKIVYRPDEDSRQQKYKFVCKSHETVMFTQLTRALFLYITKAYMAEGLTGWSESGEELSFETIAEAMNVSVNQI